jgi:nicotinamidase-related amidase
MPDLTLDPPTTALVAIDLQRGIATGTLAPNAAADVVRNAAALARRCRERGALVVLVHVDPGPGGALFPRPQADKPRPAHAPRPDFAEFVPELTPEPTDAVVLKHQPNAFYATDLEVHLARRGIRTIVLCGIATNLGVEATARAAYERGFEQVFVEDAMSARDAELHAFPVARTFPTMGRVRATADVLAALRA